MKLSALPLILSASKYSRYNFREWNEQFQTTKTRAKLNFSLPTKYILNLFYSTKNEQDIDDCFGTFFYAPKPSFTYSAMGRCYEKPWQDFQSKWQIGEKLTSHFYFPELRRGSLEVHSFQSQLQKTREQGLFSNLVATECFNKFVNSYRMKLGHMLPTGHITYADKIILHFAEAYNQASKWSGKRNDWLAIGSVSISSLSYKRWAQSLCLGNTEHQTKVFIFLLLSTHCTMCILSSMFSFQPNKLRHILKVASW